MSMSTIRSERLREGRRLSPTLVAALLGALLAGLLAGCSLVSSQDEDEDQPVPAPATQSTFVPPDVVAGLTSSLRRRAAAVREGDAVAFASGLARYERGFTRSQETYFRNLRQLPIGEFRYTFARDSMVREGNRYWVVVRLHLRLDGYDSVPVVMPDRYRFSPSLGRPDRYVLSSVTDRDWENRNDIHPQPWDLGPIEVRTGPGVLGIFDSLSLPAADALVSAVGRGIADVSGVLPYDWNRSVVVYALSDTAFLSTIRDLPGGDPESLDGVAFPVAAAPGSDRPASIRFVLHPRMLVRPGPERDRLIRHELTHVAIGDRDDKAPIWLSEGVAEYVSVRAMAPQDRLITGAAVAAAEAGVTDLPADSTFNDAGSAANYGLAWWACEYLADSFGADTLWALLDASEVQDAGSAPRLEDLIGINSRELARKAAKLMIATFDPAGPEPAPTSDPGESPGDA